MDSKIVIVGAGVAGLSVARHLKLNGFTNISIFEAKDKVGGRTNTVQFGDSYVELGAEWIHGQEDNMIYHLAKLHSLVRDDMPVRPILSFTNLGWTSSQQKEAIALTNYLEGVQREMNQDQLSNYLSLGEFLTAKFKEYPNHESAFKQAIFDWYLRLQCEINGCATTFDVSYAYSDEYHFCNGNPLVELRHGYNAIVNVLLQDILPDSIKLNHHVSKIKWATQPMQLEIDHKQLIEADHVILTIPLGCLKKNHHNLFEPSLPAKKIETIETLGFGTVNKVFLLFNQPFWKPGELFQAIWKTKPANLNGEWWHDIGWFSSVEHNPNVLCVWVSGSGALIVEKTSDEEIIGTCHEALQQLLSQELSKPIKVLKSTWGSDEFSGGSYSYQSVKTDNTERLPTDLAEPLYINNVPVVLFAGEATHSHYFSTVHGAFETGIREAERLIHKIRNLTDGSNKLVKFPTSSKQPTIAIIGAGAAGLGAAYYLTRWGFSNVVVFDSLDRCGGRILTHYLKDNKLLELGAQWVHGEEGNPLFEIANAHDLLSDPRLDYSVEGRGHFCTEEGYHIPDELVNSTIMALDHIKQEIEGLTVEYPSVGELFIRKFEYYLSTQECSSQESKYLKGIFDWYMRYEIIDNACYNMEDLSPLGYAEWLECPGVHHINFKAGFKTFVDFLSSQSKAKVRLKKPIRTIHWLESNNTDTVKLECEDGEIVQANHVIVTSSIRCLQKFPELFNPPLPDNKRTLINKMGFGTINKIYLIFEVPFWNETDLGFQLIWTQPKNSKDLSQDWASWMSGFDRVRGCTNILVGWIGGEGAEYMEQLSDEEVLQTCHDILCRFVGDPRITRPINVIRSSWSSEPYIGGAYSHRPLGYSRKQVLELSEPLYHLTDPYKVPRVLFAGEATDVEFFSTVHGALRSGHREAYRLYSHLRQY